MIFGKRVRLRAIERDDLPRYVRWFNDPEVREYLTIFLPMSQAEEGKWYDDLLGKNPVERPLAIDVLEGDAWIHIGGCGFSSVDHQARKAEFGISIGDKAFWNQGYGTDAINTLLRHGFETLNLHRVFLSVYAGNLRAIKVYTNIGFREEGRLRDDRFMHGRYEDTLIMGILREEWTEFNRV
jgi:diamine N-acetyltransferase